MKLIQILTSVTILILLAACEKEDDVMMESVEIPEWLQKQIDDDLKIIEANPKLMQNYGAWITYKFNNENFFEYDNPLSSVAYSVYSREGKLIDIRQSPYTNYMKDKCCEQYLWKAPKYLELK